MAEPALPARALRHQPRRHRAARARRGHALDALIDGATLGASRSSPCSPAAAVVNLTLNFVLACSLLALMDGLPLRQVLRPPAQLLPALALTVALTLAVAEVYERFGMGASALVLLLIVAFTYMARLVVTARERTSAVRVAVVGRAVRPHPHARPPRRRAPRATPRRSPRSRATSPPRRA